MLAGQQSRAVHGSMSFSLPEMVCLPAVSSYVLTFPQDLHVMLIGQMIAVEMFSLGQLNNPHNCPIMLYEFVLSLFMQG